MKKIFLVLLAALYLPFQGGGPQAQSVQIEHEVEPQAVVAVLPNPFQEEKNQAEGAKRAEKSTRTVDPSRPMVALTFDDGPHPVYTDEILDVLEEHHAVATFFEVGQKLSTAPEAVQRAAEMGCEIGSHSYRHANLSKLDRQALKEDLAAADEEFRKVLGTVPTLLRPPYGAVGKALREGAGYSVVTWSVDPEDWKVRDADKVTAHIQAQKDLDGQVILLHSTYPSTVEAVETLVPWLQEQGYQLVTMSELITLRFHDTLETDRLYRYDYFRRPPALPKAEDQETGRPCGVLS